LHHGDAAFGKLMRTLAERQLLDSTLVVVLGDHGEAFGRHDQTLHGLKIYEENVRVPLLFINRQLFRGAETATLGSLLDVAPTTFELLNLPPSPRWQGRSLLGQDRPPRVCFFAKWSDDLTGYREGNWKRIYNATLNQYELYDLSQDPLESTNLAATRPELLTDTPDHLAAWTQYQDRLIRAAIQAAPKR
jgi:arylsulfatase A-like enzyme